MTRPALTRPALPTHAWLRVLLAVWLAALLAALLAGPSPARAHKASDAYLSLDLPVGSGGALRGRWDIALRDLDLALDLDADGDGRITWGELKARHAEVAAYALARLQLRRGDQPCTIRAGAQQVDEHTDGPYTVLPFDVSCPAAEGALDLRYTLLAELDPTHRGLLRLSEGGAVRTAVLDPTGPAQRFEPGATNAGTTFVQFLREGVWHIWIGIDHVLFLLSLLLPAVLLWAATRWEPAPSQRAALIDVAKIVTAFTAAHSITLTLAALGLVSLPSRLVESAIAASVVLAALNNVFPRLQRRRWAMAFGFGLIHGFGFASVLAELALPQDALVLALVAFNVGVELGQLAIVAVFVPLAFAVRATAFYRRVVLVGGSWLIAALAAVWFVERAFEVTLLGL